MIPVSTEKVETLGYRRKGRSVLGDLMLVPVNGKWILTIVSNIHPRQVSWGDFVLEVDGERGGYTIYKNNCLPDMGRFVGKNFSSVEEAKNILRPFWTGVAP